MKRAELVNDNFFMDFLSLATEKDLKNSVKVRLIILKSKELFENR
jgi:hypothetical protein